MFGWSLNRRIRVSEISKSPGSNSFVTLAKRLSASSIGLSLALSAGLLAAPMFVAAPSAEAQSVAAEKRVIGVIRQWSIYGREFWMRDLVENGSAAKLTHLHYIYGGTKDGECVSLDPWADYQSPASADNAVDGVADTSDQPLKGQFNQILKLKEANPHLRVMLSIGGFSRSGEFPTIASSEESRKKYVSSCVDQFLKGNIAGDGAAYGVFDGIDLHWQWPGESDKANYIALAQEFRKQFQAYGAEVGRTFEFSAFLPAGEYNIGRGYDIVPFFNAIDYAHVQGFDFAGTWQPTTNHQGNLYAIDDPRSVFSTERAVDAVLCQGAPADKLVVTMSALARGWKEVDRGEFDGLFQEGVPGDNPDFSYLTGRADFKSLIKQDLEIFTKGGASWIYDDGRFWTFDTPEVVDSKGRWINLRGLGGGMVFYVDSEDGSLVSAMHRGIREFEQQFCSNDAVTVAQLQPQRCKLIADRTDGARVQRKRLDQIESITRTRTCQGQS